jgi:hypothetical protein
MRYIARLKRWIGLALLALTAFTQANLAYALCEMERRTLRHVLVVAPEQACECDVHSADRGPLFTNRCVAHCTADLQIAGVPPALVRSPGEEAVLTLPAEEPQAAHREGPGAPPLQAIPIRILLHSFLI